LHPTTEKKLKENNWLVWLENEPRIELRPRYDYFKFIKLMIESEFIISDGGSNQEEAAYLGKPTLLFRRVTERPEGIGENAVISEYNADKIIAFVENYKNLRKSGLEFDVSPSEIIVNSLLPFS
jgi:UDP-N-acetylglucosamine 2-epimerase (non-hydrolysing)